MRARTIGSLSAAAGAILVAVLAPSDARAQAGVAQKALPNVLLLVDTSGSMERMFDSSLPQDNVNPQAPLSNVCAPGTESNPNRWGVLLQALTGNMQPYSCAAMSRASGQALVNEYRIGAKKPYDADYYLPYHRPLSGTGTTTCAVGPWRLPGGGGTGVGPTGQSSSDPEGTTAESFPNDALRSLKWSDISANYPGAFPGGSSIAVSAATSCDFLQAEDGQLDAARDYVRFSLMTFDQDTDPGLGVTAVTGGTVNSTDPFLGQWSYTRTTPFSYGGLTGKGKPAGCLTAATDFEVGARNWAAPPWEGRLVRFSDPFGTLSDIQRTNDQIQQVLVSTRPYGATPIDAMLDDARDYLWKNPKGPQVSDPYISGGCRDQFNILLTDGAPNLNMRTSCESPGQCPYPSTLAAAGTRTNIAWDIVKDLYDATGGRKTPTFVIGFSVNGTGTFTNDGFPAGLLTKTCSSWFNSAGPSGFAGSSASMSTFCRATPPPDGSTADACCQLNEIAYYGSGGTAPPFFADSQRELVNAFGRVLAQITKSASTRTVPAYTATQTATGGAQNVTGSFTAAFVPNSRRPWSGQLERKRERCVGGLPSPPVPASPDPGAGDDFSKNLSKQAADGARLIMTVIADPIGTGRDSSRSIRPYMAASPDLNGVTVTSYQGSEYAKLDMGLITAGHLTAPAMNIDATTCRRSRDVNGNVVPALTTPADCARVVFGFAAASTDNPVLAGYNKWNVRCTGTGAGTGKCAVTGAACVDDAFCDGANKGDVCVPECSALGAIFRSTPAAVAPPISLSRDEGYRLFADARKDRQAALFVATTDGVLHAFKALNQNGTGDKHELWAFIPPAVLPKLAANYPAGQQILLDGSPVVKDVVWSRDKTSLADPSHWHTTLVAGMGSNGPGYFALNVSDVDCSSGPTGSCTEANYQRPSAGVLESASIANVSNGTVKQGPHFMWQLTDVERLPGDAALPTTRKATKADNKEFVSLFGRQTGTPAITTLYFKANAAASPREVGVAILPGGLDGPASTTGTCPRALGSAGYSLASFPDLSDPRAIFARRASIRQWGTTCAAPVAGRSLTIVRLDTGEIVRHFGRLVDTPAAISSGTRFTDSPFDSPMIGHPIPFPSDVGTVAQKIFIGDADGTMWRVDVSSPDPGDWKVNLFQDLFAGGGALEGQPIAVAPIASLDPTGNVVLNVSTGEQENLVATAAYNKVFSIVEGKPIASLANTVQAQVQWFLRFDNGERVSGPMAVFDSALYFATYRPEAMAGVCTQKARQYVYGVDYYRPKDTSNPGLGGEFRYPPSPFTQFADFTTTTGNNLIPGVAIKQSLSCVSTSASGTTDYFGKTHFGVNAPTTSDFSLDIPVAKASGSSIQKISIALPKPRTPTTIDSWALVID